MPGVRKNEAAAARLALRELLAFGVPTRLYSDHRFDPAASSHNRKEDI